jgi:hypothetical protein
VEIEDSIHASFESSPIHEKGLQEYSRTTLPILHATVLAFAAGHLQRAVCSGDHGERHKPE